MFKKKDKGAKKEAGGGDDATKKVEEDAEAAKKKEEEEAAAAAAAKAAADAEAAAAAAKAAADAEAAKKKADEDAAAAAAAAAAAEAAAKKKAEEDAEAAKKKAEEEAKKQAEEEAAARKKKEEEAKRAQEEADRRAREEAEKQAKLEEQRRKREEERLRMRWLGAPVPKGVDGPMTMGGSYDMKVAFSMLDKKRRGYLDRRQARNLCRCAGWILPDPQLDLMLDGALGTVAKMLGTGNTRPSDPNKTFTLDELCDILEKNTKGSNGSQKEVKEAAARFAASNAQIRRTKLQEVITDAPDFNEGDVEVLLQMVGLARASDMDCDNLTTKFLNAVCSPPTIFEAHKQREKELSASASNPLSLYRSARVG
mmetsp:Transcript_43454/g.93091  ORF Transcript_43454/g.93091 Transcript_43454/m.93091 type:complete len:368 (+) Transcript_43454:157-1260(+)|eukprot:CAMPEP_0206460494 /NCGR_PEP_ID=MMETSP0324_2-20121206/24781_1 /ASSEMBLY_ACC=CAM_ASM_000836 /TAXON_ID=2866 /ORGANISM="Crypthecodinium cohnii, Strain Seligo" /LENGTH=367 /DNA_ID=CAMNT_0053932199 /DNA_START=97 /DNA_END=1200 /DNA_ORIENTATION=+